jgi:hypothetical protein
MFRLVINVPTVLTSLRYELTERLTAAQLQVELTGVPSIDTR